jgi:hypothetical protein
MVRYCFCQSFAVGAFGIEGGDTIEDESFDRAERLMGIGDVISSWGRLGGGEGCFRISI